MTISIFDSIFGHVLKNRPGLKRMFDNVSEEINARKTCQRTRKELLNLSESQLNDIGRTKEQAQKEANRDFWD